jgi:hypothetical protein
VKARRIAGALFPFVIALFGECDAAVSSRVHAPRQRRQQLVNKYYQMLTASLGAWRYCATDNIATLTFVNIRG